MCISPLLPGFCFFNFKNIFFERIYLPITALFDGAFLIEGFYTTESIKKLFLLIFFFNLKIPHLETVFLLTFILAITDDL